MNLARDERRKRKDNKGKILGDQKGKSNTSEVVADRKTGAGHRKLRPDRAMSGLGKARREKEKIVDSNDWKGEESSG